MMLDNAVRERALAVVGGNLGVDDFEAWFVENTWGERSSLIDQVGHVLVQRSLLADEDVAVELAELVVRTVDVSEVDRPLLTATSSPLAYRHVYHFAEVTESPEVSGTSAEVVCGSASGVR